MHRPTPKHWALLAGVTVLLSGAGFSAAGLLDAETVAGTAGQTASASSSSTPLLDPAEPPVLAHVPPFSLGSGTLPSKSDALDFPNRYSRFIAKGDAGLDELRTEGHLSGAGTKADPYVLERFYVDGDLTIQSTHQAIILREGYVNGQLSLNYIGESVYVHHVYARDLRINENVERSGPNTGGLFHDNHFGFVGQIRHFTGTFRDNQVGPAPQGIVREYLSDTGAATLPDGVVFNFDGFHGADVHHNTFHGIVDIKLHGHNHGDCLVCPVHDHSDTAEFPNATDDDEAHATQTTDAPHFPSRHSIRYHSLHFHHNTITVPAEAPFALRYNDRAHAGDDQTANSEPNPLLEDPHVHYQDILVAHNTLQGAPLRVEVFNAADDHHTIQNQGILRLAANTITVPYTTGFGDQGTRSALDLRQADGITLLAHDNILGFEKQDDGLPYATLRSLAERTPTLIGIRLHTFSHGDLTLAGNTVTSGDYGVFAHRLDDTVSWTLLDNTFHTTTAYRAEDTAHAPDGDAGEGTA